MYLCQGCRIDDGCDNLNESHQISKSRSNMRRPRKVLDIKKPMEASQVFKTDLMYQSMYFQPNFSNIIESPMCMNKTFHFH